MTVVESRLAELGLEADEKRIIQRINDEFEKRGVEEVIMLCPNCYTFLKPYLKVKVTDIYAKLEELGIGEKNLESRQSIFALSGS